MSGAARGHLAMLLFSAMVAGSFTLGSLASVHISPVALTAMRFLLAAAILGVAGLASGGIPRSALAAPWRYLLLGLAMGLYFVLMFEGLKTAPPVSAAAVFTLTPAITAVAGYLMLRQITTPRMALALVIGGAGALWVIFRADPAALLAFEIGRGEVIYFVGCISHAVYTPLVARLNRGERPTVFSFGAMLGAALIFGVVGAPAMAATDWAHLPAIVWITLAYVAVMASAVTFVLLQYAALRLPSAKVMAYTYLTPSWVLCWEAAFGHHLPPPLVLGGVALTVMALLLLLKNEDPAR